MNIIWTPEAKQTFNSNIEYLINEWGDQVASDFLDRVDEVISKIKSNPNLFPVINEIDSIHRCVVVKQITLYYRIISKDEIYLMTFWNNYQNPEFLRL